MNDPTVADPDLLAGRLFFAVPVPGPTREPLEAALPRLEPLLGGARVTPPGGWHLTLAFLGQVQPEMADEVVRVGEAAVAGIPPARLRLEGAGTFPEGRKAARVLWAGIGGDAEVLVRLAAALSAACKAAGLRSEERSLHPHLTLARFSTPAPVPSEALDLVAGAASAGPSWEAREPRRPPRRPLPGRPRVPPRRVEHRSSIRVRGACVAAGGGAQASALHGWLQAACGAGCLTAVLERYDQGECGLQKELSPVPVMIVVPNRCS
jgi:2'-5' RNA ligase